VVACDELDDVPYGIPADAIAAPAEGDLEHLQAQQDISIVPLHREQPAVLRLSQSAIQLPMRV
jgi:hypothetical protein